MIGIGATSLAWGKAPLPDVFAGLRQVGGDCVELNLRPGQHDGLTLDTAVAPRVRDWATEAGLRIGSVAGYNDFAVRDAEGLQTEIDRLIDACRIASALEVGIVRAFVGDQQPGLTFDDVRPAVVEAFRRVLREAEPLGVTLALENHGRLLNDGPTLAGLVRELDSPHVRSTLDTGNFAWAGHNLAQVERDYAAMLPQTVSVHVKDGVWDGERFTFVPAGDGELPLAALLAQLVANGYDGPICSEYEGAGDPIAGTERSIAYLRAAYAEVRPSAQ
jgi:L-ribulose-5-phosphate 3-epimerase